MKLKFIIRSVILSAFVFIFSSAKCEQVQEKSFQYYDSLTYQQYLAGNWSELIRNGKEALDLGYDYKNLRLRIGFAYFFQKNYRTAAVHFNKALQFDSYDTVAALYFNLSCQSAGRSSEIYYVKGSRKPYQVLDFVYADAGKMLAGNANFNTTLADSNVYKEQMQPVSRTFSSLGLNFRPIHNVSVFMGYSQIEITDKKSISHLSMDAVRDSISELEFERDYWYSFPISNNLKELEFKNKQSSYYLSATYIPVPGLKISPSFHYMHINSTSVTATPAATILSDTARYNKFDSTWHTFEYSAYNYNITTADSSYSDYVLSMAASKDIGKFNVGLNGTYALMLNQKYIQFGASVSWYPFGNTNLYTNSSFTLQKGQSAYTKIFEQMVGGRIYPSGWLEGFVTLGELKNFNEKNAYLVYNQVYPVKMRWGMTFYPYIGKHLEVMLMYRYQKIGLLLSTAKLSDTTPLVSNPDYTYSTLITGVKWKF